MKKQITRKLDKIETIVISHVRPHVARSLRLSFSHTRFTVAKGTVPPRLSYVFTRLSTNYLQYIPYVEQFLLITVDRPGVNYN